MNFWIQWQQQRHQTQAVRQRGGRQWVARGFTYDDISNALPQDQLRLATHPIDITAFWRYVEAAGYRQLGYYHGGAMPCATEKWLEHYVSLELLAPKPGEVLLDVASCHSPFADLVQRLYGVTSYQQDLLFPPGIHGRQIGGDAAALPMPDAFADLVTLHCAFEHFEGDSDSGFIRELGRILKPGGRACILPLYTSQRYSIQSDPQTWAQRTVQFEPDALVCLANGWGETHGRCYDAAHLAQRVLAQRGGLAVTLYRIVNYADVAPDCYLRFALMLTRPY